MSRALSHRSFLSSSDGSTRTVQERVHAFPFARKILCFLWLKRSCSHSLDQLSPECQMLTFQGTEICLASLLNRRWRREWLLGWLWCRASKWRRIAYDAGSHDQQHPSSLEDDAESVLRSAAPQKMERIFGECLRGARNQRTYALRPFRFQRWWYLWSLLLWAAAAQQARRGYFISWHANCNLASKLTVWQLDFSQAGSLRELQTHKGDILSTIVLCSLIKP